VNIRSYFLGQSSLHIEDAFGKGKALQFEPGEKFTLSKKITLRQGLNFGKV